MLNRRGLGFVVTARGRPYGCRDSAAKALWLKKFKAQGPGGLGFRGPWVLQFTPEH